MQVGVELRKPKTIIGEVVGRLCVEGDQIQGFFKKKTANHFQCQLVARSCLFKAKLKILGDCVA